MAQYVPDRAAFLELARRGRLAFVYREVVADSDTPVSAYAKLGRGPYSFLLESVVGGEKWAAYSFVGVRPRAVIRSRGDVVEILRPRSDAAPKPTDAKPREGNPGGGGGASFEVAERFTTSNPVAFVDAYLADLSPVVPPGLPRFFGGAVGWIGYDAVRGFEKLPSTTPDLLQLPEVCFCLTDTVVIFDNLRGTVKVVAAVDVGEGIDAGQAYDDACVRIDAVLDRLARPTPPLRTLSPAPVTPPAPHTTITRELFEANVRRIQEYILAGDAFQVVYSQRFEVPRGDVDPFDVYRALRVTNPSPYMFHLDFPEAVVTGASPEVLVRLDRGELELRPIAGTKPRGATPEADLALEAELTSDPKERAEHVMLIDLGRNDLGRVSTPGTVRITEQMVVERYSHVMHIVSHLRGRLAPGLRPGDVIKATFPAGTLSGAPKIRAMEIIEELELSRRGLYGGAVGYVSYTGNLDLCIAIRTLVTKGDTIYVQAGAGIVAGSVPSAEYDESVNKARAVITAVEMARRGGDEPRAASAPPAGGHSTRPGNSNQS